MYSRQFSAGYDDALATRTAVLSERGESSGEEEKGDKEIQFFLFFIVVYFFRKTINFTLKIVLLK